MKNTIPLIFLAALPFFLSGQNRKMQPDVQIPKHYISVNPLNILLFQQAGITYEYKPGVMGFGVTTGYIYPNRKDYSNYFIAGPTNYGSLGDYSGFFVVPQVNLYVRQPKDLDQGGSIYFAFKFVYKFMQIDSTTRTAWYNEGDSYFLYRKMIDKVNIYGGFIDFGYRYFLSHFFIDLNIGAGYMWVNHDMIISGEAVAMDPVLMNHFHPPQTAQLHEKYMTINFTLNLGAAF